METNDSPIRDRYNEAIAALAPAPARSGVTPEETAEVLQHVNEELVRSDAEVKRKMAQSEIAARDIVLD